MRAREARGAKIESKTLVPSSVLFVSLNVKAIHSKALLFYSMLIPAVEFQDSLVI